MVCLCTMLWAFDHATPDLCIVCKFSDMAMTEIDDALQAKRLR